MRWAKYGHLKLTGVFLDKLIPDIDFTDEAVVRRDVPIVKILLLVIVIDIKKITNKF